MLAFSHYHLISSSLIISDDRRITFLNIEQLLLFISPMCSNFYTLYFNSSNVTILIYNNCSISSSYPDGQSLQTTFLKNVEADVWEEFDELEMGRKN